MHILPDYFKDTCSSASEVTLKITGKLNQHKPQQSATNHEPYALWWLFSIFVSNVRLDSNKNNTGMSINPRPP